MADDAGLLLRRETAAAKLLLAHYADVLGDDAQAKADAVEGETNLLEAVTAAVRRIVAIEALEGGIAGIQEELAVRAKRLKTQRESLRASIAVALETAEQTSLETPLATVSLKDLPQQLRVTDEGEIPQRFWKRAEPALDKTALKKALLAAEEVPGAALSNGGKTIQLRVR